MGIITLKLQFSNRAEFKRLQNIKEEAKINGDADNWEDFILKRLGVRKC